MNHLLLDVLSAVISRTRRSENDAGDWYANKALEAKVYAAALDVLRTENEPDAETIKALQTRYEAAREVGD